MVTAALTGGLGCGKSLALEFFAVLGWLTMSADDICHQIYTDRDEVFFHRLRERWGEKVVNPDGGIDKKSVAALIFGNTDELDWLNRLLHPMIKARMKSFILDNPGKYIMAEIPLFYEVGWYETFTPVVAVWSSRSRQYEHLCGRGWTENMIESRLKTQLPAENKLEKADYGLINNGSRQWLRQQCELVNNEIKENYGSEKKKSG